MRISGGAAKGRKTSLRLFAGKGDKEKLRPTSAKVREALFDILRSRIEGANFADLYAGTGMIAFEALSRGAGRAVLVEEDVSRYKRIREVAEKLGFSERLEIVRNRAEDFIRHVHAGDRRFDILFLDPPYQSEEIEKVLPVIGRGGVLGGDGVVVVEHFFKRKMPDRSGELEMRKQYRYGDTMLTLYGKAST